MYIAMILKSVLQFIFMGREANVSGFELLNFLSEVKSYEVLQDYKI